MILFYKTFFLASLLFFASCSSGSEKKTETAKQATDSIPAKEKFPTGVVVSPSYSSLDPTQSYALYIPKAYDGKTAFPVIFALDPHATGKLPVSMYKDLAEKYGFIIVASNNSQNGMAYEATSSIATSMFTDIQNRMLIDSRSIYMLGFSGGARLANALTITNGNIAGVICCGAANPANNMNITRNNYIFMGIGGNADFNYTEMKKYDMLDLPASNIKHTFVSFDGKHEWPPANVMEKGFLWFQLDRMRRQIIPKNDTLISNALKTAKSNLDALTQQKKEYDAYELCRTTIAYYEGLGDLAAFYDTFKKLKNTEAIDKQLKSEEGGFQKEEQLKQFYVDALQNKNAEWWKQEVSNMNKTIKTSKDKEEVLVHKRMLSFLSLASYMQASGLIKQGKIDAAEYFCKLYKLVDPTNSEADYLMAEIDVIKGKPEDALQSLNESVKNGFVDKNRLQSDSIFSTLMKGEEFKKIVEKIK